MDNRVVAKLKALLLYRFTFRHYGRRSLIIRPLQLDGTKSISIGDRVVVGEGSWLGENVCVMGASIGKHCVIGANAVVTRDVPDYSVAVGCPARVIKRYNPVTQQWQQTDDK